MPELTQAVTALPGVASAGAEPVAKGAPTREATLILLPRRFAEAAGKDLQILGLPLLHRAILAAERAGFRDIYVLSERPAADLALEGMNAALLDADTTIPAERVVIVSGDVICTTRWFERLLGLPRIPDVLRRDGTTAALIDLDSSESGRSVETSLQGRDPFEGLLERFEANDQGLYPADRFSVGAGETRAAERWLLRSLVKDTEGFMSKHVERPISLAITRRIVESGVTPNLMTIISVAIGLLSAPFFLSASPAYQLTGALLLLAHSIIDGCDGEIARLRFEESRWGGILDFWGDNVVHVAVFACIAAGAAMTTNATWPLVAGVATVGATALSAAVIYWHTMREKAGGEPLYTSVANGHQSRLTKVMDALTRRDFIYLIVVLAAFGKSAWFLVVAAVGAPIFLLMLLFIACTERH